MTLIIGYIHSDLSAHIVADSAENSSLSTNKAKENLEQTNSFGEVINTDEKDDLITESAQKIYTIDGKIALSFAGQTIEGKQTLEDLRIFIKSDTTNSIYDKINNFFNQRKPINCEFIVGFTDQNIPKLYYYKKKGFLIDKPGEFVFLGVGSENSDFTIPISYMLNEFQNNEIPHFRLLIFLIAIVQSFALNILSFQKGVGGFFNGVSIYNNQLHWAKDTCSIVYSAEFFEKTESFIVTKYNRENATFLSSNNIPDSIFHPGQFWADDNSLNWCKRWVKKLVEKNRNCDLDYFCFICYDKRIVTIASKISERFASNLAVKIRDDNKIDFELSNMLLNKILSYQIIPENGDFKNGIGINFNYI